MSCALLAASFTFSEVASIGFSLSDFSRNGRTCLTLAYNLTRVTTIVGVKPLIAATAA
jgi:hypothetical protein